jgi:hypothetical protein
LWIFYKTRVSSINKISSICAIFERKFLELNPCNLEKEFDTLRQNRNILLQILKQTPREQLARIPKGFRNNIWWNIAHVVVTQQLLLYALSDLPMAIDETLVQKYRKGSFPEGTPTEEEVRQMEHLLLSTLEQARRDFSDGTFKTFKEYTTSVGVTLKSAGEALVFDVFHEGLHLGVIMSLKKVV